MSEFKEPVDLTPCAPHLIAIHFADESYTPTPSQQKLLCDEMWRRYVNHERLVQVLSDVTENLDHARMMVPGSEVASMLFDSTQEARTLLAQLQAGKGGE